MSCQWEWGVLMANSTHQAHLAHFPLHVFFSLFSWLRVYAYGI